MNDERRGRSDNIASSPITLRAATFVPRHEISCSTKTVQLGDWDRLLPEKLRCAANRFKNTLQQHSASSASDAGLHHVFALIKPNFYLLVRASKQALPFLALHYELIAFDINFMHLMGWLVHSLVPTIPQRFIRYVSKSVRRKQKRLSIYQSFLTAVSGILSPVHLQALLCILKLCCIAAFS
ncbi:MAG: hypothetical protein CBE43_02285 [Rhodopirellula sp. TMED283]|nr:MAG: hypothetical protein CBE43_02285 [Rhodopirellula sp. TMED283]